MGGRAPESSGSPDRTAHGSSTFHSCFGASGTVVSGSSSRLISSRIITVMAYSAVGEIVSASTFVVYLN